MGKIFQTLFTKIANLIGANLKLFIAKEINGKLDKIYTKINEVESKVDQQHGKIELMEKILTEQRKEQKKDDK